MSHTQVCTPKHSHYRRWQIFVGNLLLGWTFFVWCYCVILALSPGARETD